MAEWLSLEDRIKATINEFISEWIEYEEDFVRQQVENQYPWRPIEPNPSNWKVAYSRIYPTKESKEIEEQNNEIRDSQF